MRSLIVLMFASSFSLSAFGWGQTGHRVVGEIAMKHLDKKTKDEVLKILDGRNLATVSNYADFVKSDHDFDKYNSWHYVNAPKGQGYGESQKSKNGDVIQGIIYFEDILRNKKSSLKDKQLALKFLTHLIGDAHQPLHAGYSSDRGGNEIDLTWFGKETNIHWVWDEGIIDLQNLSYTEFVKHYYFVTKKEIKEWKAASYFDWINESRSYLDVAYKAIESGKYWEYRYNYKFRDIVVDRLNHAGVRLGYFLNDIFGNRKISQKMMNDRKKIIETLK